MDCVKVIEYYKKRAFEAEKQVKELLEWKETHQSTGICETCTSITQKEANKLRAKLMQIESIIKEK